MAKMIFSVKLENQINNYVKKLNDSIDNVCMYVCVYDIIT